jgi:hypothetical protein
MGAADLKGKEGENGEGGLGNLPTAARRPEEVRRWELDGGGGRLNSDEMRMALRRKGTVVSWR